MLNVIVHYPCNDFAEWTTITRKVRESWSKKIKDKIIKESNGTFHEKNCTVAFILIAATDHPILVILYCAERIKNLPNLSKVEFERLVNRALLTFGDDSKKNFFIQTVYTDNPRTIQPLILNCNVS